MMIFSEKVGIGVRFLIWGGSERNEIDEARTGIEVGDPLRRSYREERSFATRQALG